MFWLAFTTGLFGSLHCIGMCGPIALALPMQKKNKLSLMANALSYNIGRTFTYTLLGFLIGMVGAGFGMAGLQKGLSIFIGAFLLIILLFSINIEKQFIQLAFINRLYFQLKYYLGIFLKAPSRKAIFFSGILNGLLPCGLVYVALASALTASNIYESAAYMAFFGLGTIPLMFLTIMLGNNSIFPIKTTLQRAYPAFLGLLAFWFIYRGVYVYLPPNFQLTFIPMCH